MARRAPIAAIRAAPHATKGGVKFTDTELQRFVITGDRHAPGIVQVTMKSRDFRPFFANRQQSFPHLMWQIPTHGFKKRAPLHFEPSVMPAIDHQRQQFHPLLQGERSFVIGAERIANGDTTVFGTGRPGAGDRRIHAGDLLGLRAVVVASGKCVAEFHMGAKPSTPNVDLRKVSICTVVALLIENGGRIFHAFFGYELLGDLVDACLLYTSDAADE